MTCTQRGCKRAAVAWQYSYTGRPRIVCATHRRDDKNNWTALFVPKEDKT